MRILVACDMPEAALERLRSLEPNTVYVPDIAARDLPGHMEDVGILVVRGVRVSPETITRAKTLQMIIHAGTGSGEISVEDASAAAVFVSHCPAKDATAVAELTLGLILALDRQIVANANSVRDGQWRHSELADARGLAGRTLGILGYGRVGQLVAERARAFGMRVIAWSPHMLPGMANEVDIELCNWPRELARMSDVVTVHAVEGFETEVFVDAEFLASMHLGAYLVHVGHPGAVDEAALGRAIEERNLRVALDVLSSEPVNDVTKFRFRLADLPGVICTQRIATLTEQARAATADEVVNIISSFLVSGEVLNSLNLCERSPATWQLVLRIRDQVGVMAAILDAVRADGINAEEVNSRVFTGAKASWCTIALDERPSNDALEAIRALPDVLHLELRAVV